MLISENVFDVFTRTMLQATHRNRYRYPDDSDKLMHQPLYIF